MEEISIAGMYLSYGMQRYGFLLIGGLMQNKKS